MISSNLNYLDMENVIQLRGHIIQLSTHLEHITSLVLCEILGINKDSSLSFGNKNFALSFNHKVNLITDLKDVDKEYKTKYQTFQEIRNKFAHIFDVTSFKSFENLNDQTKKSVNKLIEFYGSENENSESDLVECFNKLYSDLFEFTINIGIRNAYMRGKQDGETNSLKLFYESILEQLNESENEKLKESIKRAFEKINFAQHGV